MMFPKVLWIIQIQLSCHQGTQGALKVRIEEESRVFAVINNKIDTSKSFAFMSEYSIQPPSKWNRGVQHNLRSNWDMNYGTNDWDKVQYKVFETQLIEIQDWKLWSIWLIKTMRSVHHIWSPKQHWKILLRPDKSRSSYWIKTTLTHFPSQVLHQLRPLKDITMMGHLLSNVLDLWNEDEGWNDWFSEKMVLQHCRLTNYARICGSDLQQYQWKQIARNYGFLQIKRNSGPFQHSWWAMADSEWTSRIQNQFDYANC